MSRVLVGFGETTETRGRTATGRGDGHGFFERLLHKSPKGATNYTRLHPRGKGGPEGALVWKTFKSLKLSSDRVRQTDVRWI